MLKDRIAQGANPGKSPMLVNVAQSGHPIPDFPENKVKRGNDTGGERSGQREA